MLISQVMGKSAITAHCLIKNEERWVWYAINSVIDYVDKLLVYDTGSTDATVKIVRSIQSPKIKFEEKGSVDRKGFTALRQEMLDKNSTEWFLILDGDEIWTKRAIEEVAGKIKVADKKKEAVVIGQWACVGDVYHYSKEMEKLRNYKYAPKEHTGWRSLRAIRNIKGLHCIGLYGHESYVDKEGIDLSKWKKERLIFAKSKYFHMSLLPRSSNRKKDKEVMMRGAKTIHKKGKPFPKSIKYPEVFFNKRPKFVPSPWRKMTTKDQVKGLYFRTQNIMERYILPK